MSDVITLKNILFSYGGKTVIDIQKADFPKNRVTVVTGPNGSGKTTLLKILSGILIPEEGEISFMGNILLNGKKHKILMGNSTYVHQTPYIFSGSVRKNVLMGLKSGHLSKPRREQKLNGLLKAFDLEKYRDSKASGLSGGEKQKIALARAAGMDRDYLILDEPLAHIDTESRTIIEKILKNLAAEGKTLIIATHDHSFASRMADRVIHIENGKIIRSTE